MSETSASEEPAPAEAVVPAPPLPPPDLGAIEYRGGPDDDPDDGTVTFWILGAVPPANE